jgi:hypothetical protein
MLLSFISGDDFAVAEKLCMPQGLLAPGAGFLKGRGFRVCVRTRSYHTGKNCWVPHLPDFLRGLVALIHRMRLSLMKGAHADLSGTAWQEIGVKPHFGLSGIIALDLLLPRPFVREREADPGGNAFVRRVLAQTL